MWRQWRGPIRGSPGRRRSSWPAALLAATLLSSGFRLAPAQREIPVTVEPSQPLEGQDVILTPGGVPDIFVCEWFRGGEQAAANLIFRYIPSLSPSEQRNGPAFTGRETGGPGCSLHIMSLTLNDTGVYGVKKLVNHHSEEGRVDIKVLESPSTLAAGAVSAIVLGSLATAAALVGTLLYCVFRAQRQKNKSSKEMNPVYENTGPSAQVTPVNSSETNNTYEELQHGNQTVYDQLRW